MAEPYNISLISGQNTLYGFMTGANTIADGYIGLFTVLLVFLISFVAFKKFEGKRAFAGASFLTALVAIILRVLTWVTDTTMFASIIIAGISLIFLRWGD